LTGFEIKFNVQALRLRREREGERGRERERQRGQEEFWFNS